MDDLQNNLTFRPGMAKVIHHLDHLKKIQGREVAGPIHVSFFPNARCNLDCKYCCFGLSNIHKSDEEISFDDFKIAIDTMKKYGLKAVEFSGGGEPTLWTPFIDAAQYVHDQGLKLSLITNGMFLTKFSQETLSNFTWIRISTQSTRFSEMVKRGFEWIPGGVRKSQSYVVMTEKNLAEIKKLYEWAKNNDTVIRVVPRRPATPEWEKAVEEEVWKYGKPLLFFRKEYGSPKGCYMLWIRAAVDWKGQFLPCPSKELSPETFGYIPDDFSVCHVRDLDKWLNENKPHDMGYRCTYCNCGKDTNDFISEMMQKAPENVEFV